MFDWASSITRRCFLWVTGGLLAKSWLTPGSAARPATEPVGPELILAKMADAYALCKSYCDTGSVTTRFLTLDRELEWVSESPFSTAFVRPDRIRFEFRSHFPQGTEWHRYIVCARQEDVWEWWDIQPGVKRPGIACNGPGGGNRRFQRIGTYPFPASCCRTAYVEDVSRNSPS